MCSSSLLQISPFARRQAIDRRVGGKTGRFPVADAVSLAGQGIQGCSRCILCRCAHPVQGFHRGHVWSESPISVRTSSGRQRMNILGAMHAISQELHTISITDYIKAPQQLLNSSVSCAKSGPAGRFFWSWAMPASKGVNGLPKLPENTGFIWFSCPPIHLTSTLLKGFGSTSKRKSWLASIILPRKISSKPFTTSSTRSAMASTTTKSKI